MKNLLISLLLMCLIHTNDIIIEAGSIEYWCILICYGCCSYCLLTYLDEVVNRNKRRNEKRNNINMKKRLRRSFDFNKTLL